MLYVKVKRVNLGSSHHKIYCLILYQYVMTHAYCGHYDVYVIMLYTLNLHLLNVNYISIKLEEKTRLMFYLYRTVRICPLVYKVSVLFSLPYLGNIDYHVCLMIVNSCISLLCKLTLRV